MIIMSKLMLNICLKIMISKILKNFVGLILKAHQLFIILKTEIVLVEFDNILKVKKYDADDLTVKFEDQVNKNTRFETNAYAEPHVKVLETGLCF